MHPTFFFPGAIQKAFVFFSWHIPVTPITLKGVAWVLGKEHTSKACSSYCEPKWFIAPVNDKESWKVLHFFMFFLDWSHTFIRLNYKRCENSAVLFSVKNHLALNKMKQLWCGEFFRQIQSNGVQLIHLYRCNIDMTITLTSYDPYSTKHLEMWFVNVSQEIIWE